MDDFKYKRISSIYEVENIKYTYITKIYKEACEYDYKLNHSIYKLELLDLDYFYNINNLHEKLIKYFGTEAVFNSYKELTNSFNNFYNVYNIKNDFKLIHNNSTYREINYDLTLTYIYSTEKWIAETNNSPDYIQSDYFKTRNEAVIDCLNKQNKELNNQKYVETYNLTS